MKKLLIVMLVMAVALTLGSVSVSAAQDIAYEDKGDDQIIADFNDMTKVEGTWDGAKERVFEGTSLVISNDVCGNIWGFKVTGVEAGTYKVGYFLTINAIKDSDNPPSGIGGMQDWRFRANPYGTYLNMPYYDCTFDNIEFNGLVNAVGKKIIAVAVIEVTDDGDVELLAWPKDGYMDATLDRIVFAGCDYDFGPTNHADYEVFIEQAPHEGAAERKAADDDWTPSDLDAPAGGNNQGDDNQGNAGNDDTNNDAGNDDTDDEDNGSTNVPATGDVSAILAIVAAGAAAFGGLKLRKR